MRLHRLTRHANERGSGGILLIAATAPARAGKTIHLNDLMPDLARRTVAAKINLIIDHDPAANARSDRDHHRIRKVARHASNHLAKRRNVCVVIDKRRDPGRRLDLAAEIHILQRNIVAIHDPLGEFIYIAGYADTNRLYLLLRRFFANALNERNNICTQLVHPVLHIGRRGFLIHDLICIVHKPRLDAHTA